MKKDKTTNVLIILFFTVIFILTLLTLKFTKISFYDSSWVFQNIYKMANGGIIYNCNNIIDTPLFFLLGSIIFCLFGANFFVFNLYGAFLFLIDSILFYLIFRKLKMRKSLSVLYTLLLFVFSYPYVPNNANYNTLAKIFTLVGILLFVKKYEKSSYHFLQGIVIFLVFFTKQTIGVYYALGIVVFELFDIGFSMKFFKNQFLKLATFLSCLIVSLIIMYFCGNLYNFIDLCFGSLFEFGSSNYAFSFSVLYYLLPMVIVIFFAIFMIVKIKTITEEQKRNIKFFLSLAIFLSFNMLPLINAYHTNMSFSYYLLLYIYILDFIFISEIFCDIKHIKIIMVLCILMLLFIAIRLCVIYFCNYRDLPEFEENHPFYNSRISEESLERVNTITNYISVNNANGITTLVLSHEAATYMVPLGINNNEFDLLLSGNLGYNGIQKTINKISNMKNTEFLIFTDEKDCFYQEPKEVREYIINNLKKSGEILNYSTYLSN